MARLRPTPSSRHSSDHVFVFQELDTCSHVFLRDDAVRRPLQPPYTGPYPVVTRDQKTVTIDVNGKNIRVSIDRVKPAFTLTEDPEPPSSVRHYTTRSGRHVRFRLP